MDGKREMEIEIAAAEQRIAEGQLRLRAQLEDVAAQGRRVVSSPWLKVAVAAGTVWMGYRMIAARSARVPIKKGSALGRLAGTAAGALIPMLARRLPFSAAQIGRMAFDVIRSRRARGRKHGIR